MKRKQPTTASKSQSKANTKDTVEKKESIWDGVEGTDEWEEWERGNHRQFYKPERLCSDGCSLKIAIDIEGPGPRGQFHVLAQTFRGSREYCGVIGGIAYCSHIMIAVIKGEPPTDNYTGQEALYIVNISESRETLEGFNYTIPEYIYWGRIRKATDEERKEVFALYGVVAIEKHFSKRIKDEIEKKEPSGQYDEDKMRVQIYDAYQQFSKVAKKNGSRKPSLKKLFIHDDYKPTWVKHKIQFADFKRMYESEAKYKSRMNGQKQNATPK